MRTTVQGLVLIVTLPAFSSCASIEKLGTGASELAGAIREAAPKIEKVSDQAVGVGKDAVVASENAKEAAAAVRDGLLGADPLGANGMRRLYEAEQKKNAELQKLIDKMKVDYDEPLYLVLEGKRRRTSVKADLVDARGKKTVFDLSWDTKDVDEREYRIPRSDGPQTVRFEVAVSEGTSPVEWSIKLVKRGSDGAREILHEDAGSDGSPGARTTRTFEVPPKRVAAAQPVKVVREVQMTTASTIAIEGFTECVLDVATGSWSPWAADKTPHDATEWQPCPQPQLNANIMIVEGFDGPGPYDYSDNRGSCSYVLSCAPHSSN